MFFKKSLNKLKKEISSYIEKEDYYHAGIIAENEGYKKLADEYYDIAIKKFKDNYPLKILRKENVFPSKKCHQEIINYSTPFLNLEYNLRTNSINN